MGILLFILIIFLLFALIVLKTWIDTAKEMAVEFIIHGPRIAEEMRQGKIAALKGEIEDRISSYRVLPLPQ